MNFELLYILFFFTLGLIFGSFANVCIYRIPRNKSIIKPRSHCVNCGNKIPWYDNIPILSFILLKGRCRFCKVKISYQYIIFELITGLSFAYLAYYFLFRWEILIYLTFTFILIIASGIDFYHKIIPDRFSISLIIIGLSFSVFNSNLGIYWKDRLINSFIGLILGGGSLLLVGIIAEKILKKEAMGGGDIKLLAGIGSLLGWQKIFSIVFIASLLGSLVGIFFIISKRLHRGEYIPFGPFLSLSAYINIFLNPLWFILF